MDLEARRCYRALLSRDQRFDGRFFIGVVTTGIYCRPVCPAPPPKPQNVRFYPCAAAAEAAGFRPCLRCRPETAPGTPAWIGASAVVSRALRLIGQGGLDAGTIDDLAGRLGIGARQLRRLFAEHLGASPVAIAGARRVHFARRLLDETNLPMAAVAFSAGFASVRQFNHSMRATFGHPPRLLRQRRRTRDGALAAGGLRVRLPYRPPLAWRALLRFLAARAIPGVEAVGPDGYRRTIHLHGTAGTIALRPSPAGPHLIMTVELPSYEHLREVVDRARRIFDLDADLLPITDHLRRSPGLAHIKLGAGLRVPGAWDGFELAVRAILGQQVTVRGATTLAGRLVGAFGTPLGAGADAELTHLFPGPAVLADADLSLIGLPRARAATIRALAIAVADGTVVLDASRGLEHAVAALCAVPGIGAWTAQYIAMRAYGEPDAFPASDLGLRRALGNGRGPLAATAVEQMAEAWRPWRAYAAMHLWTEGGKIQELTSPRRRGDAENSISGDRSKI